MSKFSNRHTLSKAQLQNQARKQRNRPGGKQQAPGTQPQEHRLPDKPAFMPYHDPGETSVKQLKAGLGDSGPPEERNEST